MAGALIWAVQRWWKPRPAMPTPAPTAPASHDEPDAAPAPMGDPPPGPPAEASPPAPPIPPPDPIEGGGNRARDAGEAASAGPSKESPYGNIRTSYRILLHVARQGRTAPGDIPPIGLTQTGMIEALGVNQGTLAGPLQRLVVSGALTVERGHARGVDRRVKVYRLTTLGERLVEELRKNVRGRRPSPPQRRDPPGSR